MKTMAEYIKSQDKPFTEKPFTDADAVILSSIANIDLSYFYRQKNKEIVRLGDLVEEFVDRFDKHDNNPDIEFLKLVRDCDRYADIPVTDVVHEISRKNEKQFGAITFYPQDGLAYVGYMGTGTSVIGYKEDLNMAFMNIIPAQEEAVLYLNSVKDKLPDDVRVGGFSKGGNLAVFASAFCNPEVGKKIKQVYNHDGPGFTDLIVNEDKYQALKPIIKAYVPEASIVGLTLEHDNDYRVVKSTNRPVSQHMIYSWLFDDDDLYEVEKLSNFSTNYQSFLKDLLESMDNEERKKTINAIFEVIMAIEPDSFYNLTQPNFQFRKKLRESWKEASKDTKRALVGALKYLGKSAYQTFKPWRRKKKKDQSKDSNNEINLT